METVVEETLLPTAARELLISVRAKRSGGRRKQTRVQQTKAENG